MIRTTKTNHPLFLFSLCLPLVISCIDMMAVSIAVHPIMQQLSLSLSQAQWIMSAYTIGNAAFIISIGAFSDKYGRRKIFCTGIFVFMFASLIGAFSDSIATLILARFLQGIASATLLMSSIAIITAQFNPIERSIIISKWGFALSLGMIAGPAVGGIIITFANWQTIFWLNIPICLISLFLVTCYISKDNPEDRKSPLNLPSIALLSITLLSLLNTLMLIQDKTSSKAVFWSSGCLFILFGLGFIVHDIRSKEPLIDFSFFKISSYIKPALCGFISYFCLYGWLIIIGIYLQKSRGMTAFQSGAWCLFFSLGFALSAKINILLLRRFVSEQLLQIGWIIMTLTLWMMHLLNKGSLSITIITLFLLFGIGLGITNTGSMASALKPIKAEQAGTASGILFTIRWIGGAIGVVITMALFARGGLSTACLGLFFVCIAGIPLLSGKK